MIHPKAIFPKRSEILSTYQRFALAGSDDRSTREMAPREQAALQMPQVGVSYPRVNEHIHGKRRITPDTALHMERLFGMEAQFWINLQLVWDLYAVSHSPAVKSIRKIRRITPKVA